MKAIVYPKCKCGSTTVILSIELDDGSKAYWVACPSCHFMSRPEKSEDEALSTFAEEINPAVVDEWG